MRPLLSLLCLVAAVQAEDPVAYAVAGKAVDAKGEPVPGLMVQVWDGLTPERFLAQGNTGPKGRFLVALRAGNVKRREHAHGPLLLVVRGEGIALQRQLVRAGRRDVEVRVGPARTVKGRVLDAGGSPMPALVVRGAVGDSPWVETTTGEDGGFALAHLPADGDVRLEVIGDGFVHETAAAADIELPALRTFRAQVTAAGKPVADAEFWTTTSLGTRVAAVSDAKGWLSVPALGNSVAGIVTAAGHAPVKLTLTGESRVALTPTAPLRGRVVDGKDRPVAGCLVEWRHGVLGSRGVWTDDKGAYSFDVVPRGMVDLSAQHRDFLTTTVRTNGGVTLQLRKGARVAGRVQRNGAPAMGVRVSVGDAFAFSDGEGRYLVNGVVGDASLFAHERGWRSASESVRGATEGATLGPFALTLQDHLPLRGRLMSDAGTALAGVEVQVGKRKTTTGPDGRFAFDSVPVGDRLLEAVAPRHFPMSRHVQPGADEVIVLKSRFGTETLEIEVTVPETFGVTRVEIMRRDEPRVRRYWDVWPLLADDGAIAAVFEDLPAGQYDVAVRAEGYLPVFKVATAPGKLAVQPQLGGALRLTATPGAVVAIQRVSGKAPPVSALELEDGKRELRGFGPGKYRFIARARGELIVIREIELGPTKPPQRLDLRGGKESTLTVKVVNAVNEPVEGAAITLVSETGFRWRTRVTTDAAGVAKLSRLIAGRVEVFAKRGNREGATALVVKPGAALDAAIVVR